MSPLKKHERDQKEDISELDSDQQGKNHLAVEVTGNVEEGGLEGKSQSPYFKRSGGKRKARNAASPGGVPEHRCPHTESKPSATGRGTGRKKVQTKGPACVQEIGILEEGDSALTKSEGSRERGKKASHKRLQASRTTHH